MACSKNSSTTTNEAPPTNPSYTGYYEYPSISLNPGDGELDLVATSITDCKDSKGVSVDLNLCPLPAQAPLKKVLSPAGLVSVPVTGASSGFVQVLVSAGAEGIRDVSAGQLATCVVTKNNRMFCFGNNSGGKLGIGTTTSPITTPTIVNFPN